MSPTQRLAVLGGIANTPLWFSPQVTASLSIPFWQWFLGRFGKKTAASLGLAVSLPTVVAVDLEALRRDSLAPSCLWRLGKRIGWWLRVALSMVSSALQVTRS